jgi:hypothetical protein
MVYGLGANLINDQKRGHPADLRREHLIDHCVLEILPPEK